MSFAPWITSRGAVILSTWEMGESASSFWRSAGMAGLPKKVWNMWRLRQNGGQFSITRCQLATPTTSTPQRQSWSLRINCASTE